MEQYLDSPTLSGEFICARSGWSRATVYRLFESGGGLVRYIRTGHLLHASRELTSGLPPHLRIVGLALAHQFAGEASFNRAFRRACGIPPGRARHFAAGSPTLQGMSGANGGMVEPRACEALGRHSAG
ncbi:MAG: helix-turn-helix domain-containing protein [Steroidobacteraceae bacterium]